MALGRRTRVGNVFSVPLGAGSKKFFQYIANDRTQLNSDVIRAFKTAYPIDANPDLNQVVRDDVDFYAHVVIKWGIKMGLWEKIGNVSELGELGLMLFRDTNDYGDSQIKKSQNWYVWKLNEEFQKIGKLEGDYRKAEIGVVVSPPNIVHRMRTGEYNFVYPGY